MAIALVQTKAVHWSGSAQASPQGVTLGAAPTNGNILLGITLLNLNSPVVTWPAGFTSIFTFNDTGFTKSHFEAAWKLVSGDAAAESISWTVGSTSRAGIIFSEFSGTDTTTPFEVVSSAGTSNFTNSVVSPTVTTLTANAWHLAVWGSGNTSSVPSTPAGYSVGDNNANTTGLTCGFWTKLIAAAGATGTVTTTVSNGSGNDNYGFSLSLKPAGGTTETFPAGYGTPFGRTGQSQMQQLLVQSRLLGERFARACSGLYLPQRDRYTLAGMA